MTISESPFLGVAYRLRSKTLASDRCVNLYPEIAEANFAAAQVGGLYGCPGLVNQFTLPTGPVRGLLSAMGNLYAVGGNVLYVVNSMFEATAVGSLATTTGPVSMVANPTQVAVFDSVGGYAYSSAGFVNIALPFSGAPGVAAYIDGLALLSQPGTFNIWQSNVNDLTTWDALNFTTEDGTSDNVVALVTFHDQIAVFKENNTCFYVNAGLPGFVFQRLQGIYPETGCEAPFSAHRIEENLLWLGQTKQGDRIVYIMKGYEPERVSTHALEYEMSTYSTVTDAISFTYQQEGHEFYALIFPTAGTCWCLDLTATKRLGVPAWHERASFSGGEFTQYLAQCHAAYGGYNLVGDYKSGNVYSLNLGVFTDNGQTRKWLRSWRAIPKAQYEPNRFNFLELSYESGLGVPAAANPQFILRYSDDSYSWSSELYTSAGHLGETGNIARWNRLGMTRRGINSDRIFELSSTDPFKVALLGAVLG